MVLIKQGDHRAFSHLYDRFAPGLNGFFIKMLWSDTALAEDQVQDLFTKILDRPELFKDGYKVKPWLFQIASNMCKNTYRKRAFEVDYRQHLMNEGIQFASLESRMDEQIQLDLLTKSLDRLSEEERSIFLLRYQQELSIKELS